MAPQELIKVINKSLNLDITQKTRKREVVYARFIFYHKLRYAKKYYSFQMIADYLGKDHASVIHGIKQYELLKEYDDFKEIIDKVEIAIDRAGGYESNRITKLLTNHFEIRKYNEQNIKT
jgi:chromosomal replication initiation ATPase DnaA